MHATYPIHRGIDKLKHKIVEFIKNTNLIYEMIETGIKDEQKKYAMRMINKLLSLLLCVVPNTETCILSLSRQTRNMLIQ